MKNSVVLKCLIPLLLIDLIAFGQTPTFLSTFEDRKTDPETGNSPLLETSSGSITVVANPHSDDRNASGYVLKVATEPSNVGRAEYTAGRYETNEKKYIYTWKRYHAPDMLEDVSLGWCLVGQWKTWPCPTDGNDDRFEGAICYPGGGIFNDIRFDGTEFEYLSRAYPYCGQDYTNMPRGYWNDFVLEVYWTNTTDGYYRIWRNDTLWGYGNNMKTLFDGFEEYVGECDINWSNGVYCYWEKTGGNAQDELAAYLDDIAIYDIDNGYTIESICPDCEAAPPVPTDSSVYKINVNHSSAEPDGYYNYIISWSGDTSAIDISSNFGHSNSIDVYLFSDAMAAGNNTLDDECFPNGVISTSVSWDDSKMHQIYLKDLTPSNTYTFKLLGATSNSETSSGTQIWTTDENRDTVLATGNTCNMAELTNLVPDVNGDLTINVQTINGSTGYINAIEIVEYTENNSNFIENIEPDKLNIFPNPVHDNFIIKGEIVPSNIKIFSYDGKLVKYAENTNIVNVSDLKKGIYIVSVNMHESFVTLKIIKE